MSASHYDLIVIGGGAAGFFTAITCAEVANEPKRILILEKAPNVLQKVKISGGGRCNVTHDCHDPRQFVTHYPRGERALPGPLHRWNAADMIDWLSAKGVELKVEADGRMFPVTDDSQTVINCFHETAKEQGIEVQCRQEVTELLFENDIFSLRLKSGAVLNARKVVVATGGTRTPSGVKFAENFGHTTQAAVPSLFTFKISDHRLEGLAGISVAHGVVSVAGTKYREAGPVLITHWGLSGPGVLKVSARGARELSSKNYHFKIRVNWAGDMSAEEMVSVLGGRRLETGKQSIYSNAQFSIPSRLWRRLCEASGITEDTRWGNMSKSQQASLVAQVSSGEYSVTGKSMNKEEFVTCGGVSLKEINFKTMQSKLQAGLYFVGEVLDIDGVTGGFNFQSAWTTGRIAGESVAGN